MAAGDAFKSILDKKAQLKEAMEGTDVGVKPPTKKAVETKRVVETEPTKDGKPTKYTVPRDKDEGLNEFSERLRGLIEDWKVKQK
jgi:hypothetical protein